MPVSRVKIRPAVAEDWQHIYPFYAEIVEAGETYAFPLGPVARGGAFVVDGGATGLDRGSGR